MARVTRWGCDMCAFEVQSENDDETIQVSKKHAKDTHDMDLSDDDVRGKVENLDVAD